MPAANLTSPRIAELNAELVRYTNLLRRYERDHLEYGVPRTRQCSLSGDMQHTSLDELENVCATLRAALQAAHHAEAERSRHPLGPLRRRLCAALGSAIGP